MLEVKQSRAKQLIEIGALCIEVQTRNGDVSDRTVRKLKASRNTLRTMYSDADLRPIAEKSLVTVDNMLEYIEKREQHFLDAAIVAYKESDDLIYALLAKGGAR